MGAMVADAAGWAADIPAVVTAATADGVEKATKNGRRCTNSSRRRKRSRFDEKDPRGNKMSRTFELSSDGRQLYETLHMTTGRNNTPLVIRYVYDISEQTVTQSKQ